MHGNNTHNLEYDIALNASVDATPLKRQIMVI